MFTEEEEAQPRNYQNLAPMKMVYDHREDIAVEAVEEEPLLEVVNDQGADAIEANINSGDGDPNDGHTEAMPPQLQEVDTTTPEIKVEDST